MMVEFKFADKSKLDLFFPELFQILHSNMSKIAPTNNSYQYDYELWSTQVLPAMQKEQRQIVLMYVDNKLSGYFQYYINKEHASLMMEEIQIKKEFHGTGLFSEFYRWFVKFLPNNIEYVEAYANKKNYKSQSVLEHLGLVKMGENKNGNSFFYKGKYVELLNRYG
jgi:RimJ/RimL family protein N-acetyltransferase